MQNFRLVQISIIFPISCALIALSFGINTSLFIKTMAFLLSILSIMIIIFIYRKDLSLDANSSQLKHSSILQVFIRILPKFLYVIFCVIFLIKALSYFTQTNVFTRVEWLHHYSDNYLFFLPMLLYPILVCIFFYNFHRSRITIFDAAFFVAACAMLLMDGTRISFFFFALAWLLFLNRPIRWTDILWPIALLFVAILVVSIIRLSASPADFLAGLFRNIFHSFVGGFFLYEEHAAAVIQLPSLQYNRPWIIQSVPGLDIFFSTVFDRWLNTDFSLTHFASVFWEMNEFRFVEHLGVPMNSYYTGLVFLDTLGPGLSVAFILPTILSAIQPSSVFSKISAFWLCIFFMTFSMYFININMGFALVFLVSFCHGLIVLTRLTLNVSRRFWKPS